MGYGRGGIAAAPYFEWGGLNPDDSWGFETKRPGWHSPIHQLMVKHRVSIFFHGHDHVYGKEELDGIVYQECPRPNDALYESGDYGYHYAQTGIMVENSGHLRVSVSSENTTVDYIRSYKPGEGPNKSVDPNGTYTISAVPANSAP